MSRIRIFTPGPTPVPPQVTAAMAGPMDHHRTASHRRLLREITHCLQKVFQTRADCLTLTGSGTAGMEAAIVSACDPAAGTLVVSNGKFSQRWGRICETYRFNPVICELDWGTGARRDDIARHLDNDPAVNTVIVTHSETTTAAVSDLEAIARLTRERGCLLIVDGITSVGAIPVKMDEWGVDICVTSSQKALMTPPGLALIAVNDRAWERIGTLSPPATYLSLKAYRKALEADDSPFTPAITLMMGLRKALELVCDEGIEHIWLRTARLARAMRAAVGAMGLHVFARDPVDSLTAVAFPPGLDADTVRRRLRERFGYVVAGGQERLKGRVIRVNHMGWTDEADLLGLIGSIELVLLEMNHPLSPGSGMAAAVAELAGVGTGTSAP